MRLVRLGLDYCRTTLGQGLRVRGACLVCVDLGYSRSSPRFNTLGVGLGIKGLGRLSCMFGSRLLSTHLKVRVLAFGVLVLYVWI